jgi:hypothetical protein
MDALLESTKVVSGAFPTWDLATVGGIVPIITGDAADEQGAAVTTFLQRGTIPQLPEAGIPWAEYMTGTATFAEVDNKIRADLQANGHDAFTIEYSIVNDAINAMVVRR